MTPGIQFSLAILTRQSGLDFATLHNMQLWSKWRQKIGRNRTYIFIFILLIFSLYTRLLWINQIPANLNPDEADTLRSFIATTKRPFYPSILATNWNGAPAINMYLIGWGWHLGGEDFGRIRNTAVFFSTLSVLVFFLAIKRLTKSPELAFAVTLLLASDPIFMHFSRSGWENIFLALPVGITLLILARAPTSWDGRWRRAMGLILVGVLALYFYHPGKILFGVNLFLGLVELARYWWYQRSWRSTRLVILSCLLVALTVLPFLYSFLGPYRIATMGRINNVSVLAYDDAPQNLMINTRKVLLGFTLFRGPDFAVGLNDRYSDTTENLLLPILVILFWLGFILAIKKRPLLVWWFLVLLLPVQIFSTNSPDIARSVHLWPVIYWFIAMSVWQVGRFVTKYRRLKCAVSVLGLCFVFALAYLQLNHYFSWMSSMRALKSREPAIWDIEYWSWLQAMKDSVDTTGFNYGVYEWKAKTGQSL